MSYSMRHCDENSEMHEPKIRTKPNEGGSCACPCAWSAEVRVRESEACAVCRRVHLYTL